MSKIISVIINVLLLTVVILYNFWPSFVPNLAIEGILLIIAGMLLVSLLDSTNMSKKIDKHLSKLVDQKNVTSHELVDSLMLGFDYCKNNVSEFRVYAISSTKILSYIEPNNNIHIKTCKLMVRCFDDRMSDKDMQFENEIENNISRWIRLEKRGRIEKLIIVRYNNYPLDYCCIFDKKFLSLGLYLVDNEDISNVLTEMPFSITKQTESGKQMITKYTKRFDSYFDSKDSIRGV